MYLNSIQIHSVPSKSARSYYSTAYRNLRCFYRLCKMNVFTDDQLASMKLALWKIHGKYLDIVWEHHFAYEVAWQTGIGTWHGWHNSQRLHTYAKDWSAFYTRCVLPF